MGKNTVRLGLVLWKADKERADALIDRVSEWRWRNPFAGKANRSDVLRLAIRIGLDHLENDRPIGTLDEP